MRIFVLAAAVALAGCATIVKGTDQQVSLSTPGYPGAECTLSSGEVASLKVITPTVVTLPSRSTTFRFNAGRDALTGRG